MPELITKMPRSIDGLINPNLRNKSVPNWNYILVRFQVFLLYFYAGVKKMDPEWLGGYSMRNLGRHWVFTPFKYVVERASQLSEAGILKLCDCRVFLSEENIEYYMVHLGGFVLDLTVGFWLLWPKSRPLALFFAASFHLMNSQLFTIGIFQVYNIAMKFKPSITGHHLLGMFPYVCLATLPVFCDYDWPKRWIVRCPGLLRKCLPDSANSVAQGTEKQTKSSRFKVFLMGFYVATQLVLPWSHSVTQVKMSEQQCNVLNSPDSSNRVTTTGQTDYMAIVGT